MVIFHSYVSLPEGMWILSRNDVFFGNTISGKTTAFSWGKWMKMVASGVNGYRATVPCLRPLGEVPPTHLEVGFEIFRRCGGLRAIPTLSSFMNLGQRCRRVKHGQTVKVA